MENLEIDYNKYRGKRVLITGHTGFKGGWLVSILSKIGADVTGYSLRPTNELCIYNKTEGDKKCRSIIGDIRDKSLLEKVVLDVQPDFIFHMAAQSLVIKSYEIPSETFDVNVVGTANILESIKQLEKRCAVVVITTDKVYENNELAIAFKENDRLGGYDPYSASKACTELVVSSFRNSFYNIKEIESHQKSVASVRAGNVIGGGDYSENRLIPDIINALNKKEKVVLRSPKSIRPWQHVLEPLFAYLKLGLLLTDNPERYSIAYNIGPKPEDNLTVKEVVEKAIEIWGEGEIFIDESEVVHEAYTLKLDISRAKKILNWSPIYTSNQAIEKTIEWYSSENKQETTNQQIEDYFNEI